MKRYDNVPIAELVNDVPVDRMLIKELVDSIKSRGQLNPVILCEETREIVDGFHRVAAMAEIGFNQAECVLITCDDDVLWHFRIFQASLHENVTFARVTDQGKTGIRMPTTSSKC